MAAFAEFAAGNIDVLSDVLAEGFVEHSPGNPSGRDAFIDYVRSAPVSRAKLDLKRVVADDKYVVMHYRMAEDGDLNGTAVVDIWRLEDGMIVEHWDVVQPVPDPVEVPNGMF
ncbi:nuclear transport factor 2 family protein [Kribbella solani]